MTYPALTLFPSDTTFPSSGLPVSFGGYFSVAEISVGSLVLTATDQFGATWITSTCDGFFGSPGSSIQLEQKTRAPGAWPSQRNLTSRSMNLTGAVEAASAEAAWQAINRLSTATSLGDTLLTVSIGGTTLSCLAARQGDVLPAPINQTTWQWSIGLVAAEPRKFGAALTASTSIPSTVGGFTAPLIAPLSSGAAVASGVVTLTNPGNAAGTVKVRLDGPLNSPTVTHVQSGLAVASSLNLPVGQFLMIDMEARAVLANGQSSRAQTVTQRGYSAFTPGVNQWALSVASGTGQMTVIATPAYL